MGRQIIQLCARARARDLRTARARSGAGAWRSSDTLAIVDPILTEVARQVVAQNSEADREVAIDSTGVESTSASEYFAGECSFPGVSKLMSVFKVPDCRRNGASWNRRAWTPGEVDQRRYSDPYLRR